MTPAARPGRRRRVERVADGSDVRRFRAFLPAALAGGLALLLLLLLREGPSNATAPAPLARPHASLQCASCHATTTALDACANCHAQHGSEREGHRALQAAGELDCVTCHAIHREEGIAFRADGRVFFYGSGFEHELAVVRSPSRGTSHVPLVPASACENCHRTQNPRDVAAHCFSSGSGRAFALCFDEHRKSAASGTAPAERDAAVEAARSIVQTHGLAARAFASTFGASALYVLFGLGVSLGALRFARRRTRRAESRAQQPAVAPNGVRRLPLIDASRCLGCEACVDACPYDALAVRHYVAALVRPADCCGAGPCQAACPNGSLTLRNDEAGPARGPVLSERFECAERPGLFVAGDASGSSLIRNALRQGVSVAETVAERSSRTAQPARDPHALDLIVVGAGPAGLAAALTAKARGLSVLVLEQASIAESIRRFSRGKLVLDAPSGDELALPLYLADAPKEELLGRWQRTVRRAGLEVREGARVVAVAPDSGASGRSGFRVSAELAAGDPAEFRASHVLLAIGSRGTPRPFPVPVPDTLQGRVHYELSDARTFAGKRVLVVGLGDVAMESALALATQPGTEVSVVHRGAGFRRGKQRNIDALSALAARGRVKLWFRAEVERLEPEALFVRAAGDSHRLRFDALFVHIGALPADGLLRAAGVCLRS